MGDHRKLPRLGKQKKEVLLSLHIWLGATVEEDFPLAPGEIPVKLYSHSVFVDHLLSSMSGTRHYLRPLDGMMLEVARDDVRADYERLYNEWQRRQWRDPRGIDNEKWRISALAELRGLDERELSVKGHSEFSNPSSIRGSKAWKEKWGSLEASCYAALNALERDGYIWRKRFKPKNRVNEVMKIGLTMKGLQFSRALMEKTFSEYAVELREGFTKSGLPEVEHDRLIASFRLRFGLVRPTPSG